MSKPGVRTAPLPPRLVLFDGVCSFCDGAVRWLLDHDRRRRLAFGTLQGDTAAALRARHPGLPDDIDTIAYVISDAGGERVLLRSEAIFAILDELGGVWRCLAWLRWLPRFATDAAYRAFARNRYRVFGKRDTCVVPDPSERARFVA